MKTLFSKVAEISRAPFDPDIEGGSGLDGRRGVAMAVLVREAPAETSV